MATISQTVDIEMLEKLPDGTFKRKYPKTTYANIVDPPAIPTVVNALTSTSTTSALSAAQGKILNDTKAKLETGSYVGTGTTGTQTLVFQFKPKLVIVGMSAWSAGHPAVELILIYPTTHTRPTYLSSMTSIGGRTHLDVTWSDNSVSWSGSTTATAERQYNASDTTYYYIALG